MSPKKYLKYSLYIFPGYGLYKEFKKPKEKRRIHKTIGWIAYGSGAVLKLALIPSYIILGIETGEWNPVKSAENLFKETKLKIENVFAEKENKLEKTLKIE